MAVSFDNAARGRSGRVPFSYYMPVINNSAQPFYKVMPQNAVPTGMGNQSQQIGYWNEQVRWRMSKGQRKDLPSKWHFYYLGTGPHAELPYRQRQQGVFWVAKEGAKTQPTGLGSRGRNAELINPRFSAKLPDSIEIVDNNSRPSSRANSRARSQSSDNTNRSRSQSSNRSQNPRSQSRGRQPNQANGSNNNGGRGNQQRNRSNSRNRGNSNQNSNNHQDLVAAVREALAGLGIKPSNSNKSTPATSGHSTPKRSNSSQPAEKKNIRQVDKPTWKRVPHSQESVDKCFGPRSTSMNFGDAQLVRLGVDYPHFPQIAELVPTQAALLFGSEITAHEVGDDIEITYVYKMRVPKSNRSLVRFLPHVGAYADDTQDVTLDPSAPPFTPRPQRTPRSVAVVDGSVDAVEDVIVEADSADGEGQFEEVVDDVVDETTA
ncbi:nucleocapsid protein [Alphacoronavirus Bat-CoV/P.kuhlii/Italy/3398-19/2015]|uniref:Nucleoprotein n=1 Tax=Alphacoronavirus Bat-CoV/P.kuhlii/Italy/3398-19/2015 TaxID=2492658 RepID=A0A3G8EWJ5_9ALPC|nr:nucleocapsid protein [Alphacoronavirus Bat-CoV/P.kuhlii/Italy/3398-19/2015]AZF86128.1 nucleocapsid protein [Alphacoronavirus Bat-CoV/P.kuhlii/Italy/3398-19/2015]